MAPIRRENEAFFRVRDDKAEGKDAFQKANFMIDFTDYEDGSVEKGKAKAFIKSIEFLE